MRLVTSMMCSMQYNMTTMMVMIVMMVTGMLTLNMVMPMSTLSIKSVLLRFALSPVYMLLENLPEASSGVAASLNLMYIK